MWIRTISGWIFFEVEQTIQGLLTIKKEKGL